MNKLNNNTLWIEKAYINGAWIDAQNGDSFEVNNPATAEIIGTVPDMGAAETNQAIDAASAAFIQWKKTTATERYTVLNRWYQLMMDNADDLAALMVLEQGKPLAEAKGEVVYAAKFIQWFAEQAKRINGVVMSNFSPNAQLQYTKEAVGVVGVITPWNFPLAMITRKVAPALAAGCTCVIKPSELTPYSALALIKLLEDAGLPTGVVNVVTTTNAAEVGGAMTASSAVRKISFTGSTQVGKTLLRQSADTVKRMSMELGGNAPFIVFDDADLDTALNALIISKFRNTGQTCICANRIFVHDAIHDKFVSMLKDKVANFVVGDGFTEGVNQGPLINQKAVEKVEQHVKSAVEQGAEVIIGGARHKLGGTFFQPTILTNVKADAIFSCEETFGPVAPIIRFDDEQTVIKQANDTDYGLCAYFCTQDYRRINRVISQLESGMVGVNEGVVGNEFGPFGGVKESGIGRESAEIGIDEYLEYKYSLISYA